MTSYTGRGGDKSVTLGWDESGPMREQILSAILKSICILGGSELVTSRPGDLPAGEHAGPHLNLG